MSCPANVEAGFIKMAHLSRHNFDVRPMLHGMGDRLREVSAGFLSALGTAQGFTPMLGHFGLDWRNINDLTPGCALHRLGGVKDTLAMGTTFWAMALYINQGSGSSLSTVGHKLPIGY